MGKGNLLKKLYLFKDLSESELSQVAEIAKDIKFSSGDMVFSEGSAADALYVVRSGTVKICQNSDGGDLVEVTRIGAGSHFGEMSFLDGKPRSATAIASGEVELVALDYKSLSLMMIQHPGMAVHFYRQFADFLCGRLRATTNDLSFSRSRNISHF